MKHLNRDRRDSFLLAPVQVVVLSVYNACVRSWMSIKRLSTAGNPEIQPRVAPGGTSAVYLDVLDTTLLARRIMVWEFLISHLFVRQSQQHASHACTSPSS
ncbi:hypothetical protein MUK42_03360 [Musa troglodytarum]|uniref:Uncharacterized protein n=1 Tax=Musa troglodytarum TaxID=320322 RepID=A0A9E7GRL5_9LILI|nr:hypothetical protein MUK42_03360 [Musa troglodytarum]